MNPAGAPWPKRAYAWYVVVILMVAYGFAILDRVAIGLLVQPIETDLNISDSQIGLLQGFAFGIFYSVLGMPLGFLVDRWQRRRIVTIGIALWSFAPRSHAVWRAASRDCSWPGSASALANRRFRQGPRR